ncbi:MAG TPA: cytochrome c biogenesis protein CcsA [Tepidisphaeraceae bacterium]|nr:cytochrome c biogenesis protein CcsA [Tepidisphaeraceae bacterium]
MPEPAPNAIEVTTLLIAAGLLLASVAGSLARQKRTAVAVVGWMGILVGLAVLILHSIGRGAWLPLEDNFDALGSLGLMLAGCALYIQGTRPVAGLDWFVLPVAALMLIAAAVFGSAMPRQYRETAWSFTHRLTAYGGALALAIAGAVGAMYLVADRRVRDKRLLPGRGLGNLERLENIAQHSLALGWPLFTIGLITGILWGIDLMDVHGAAATREFFGPKVLLAVGVWIVFAFALHTPINPSFRGRKAAVLSLIGLVLVGFTLVAVQFMPGGAH